MNGLRHLTILTNQFCLALSVFHLAPTPQNLAQAVPNFFHLARDMATTFMEREWGMLVLRNISYFSQCLLPHGRRIYGSVFGLWSENAFNLTVGTLLL